MDVGFETTGHIPRIMVSWAWKGIIMNPSLPHCAPSVAYLIAAMLISTTAGAAPLVLNCKIESGSSTPNAPTQIMIDAAKGIAVYNYQWVGPNPKKQVNVDGRSVTIDNSMKITADNDEFVVASDPMHTLVITKRDARFAYAYAQPIPTRNGGWYPAANAHMGSCVADPFK